MEQTESRIYKDGGRRKKWGQKLGSSGTFEVCVPVDVLKFT